MNTTPPKLCCRKLTGIDLWRLNVIYHQKKLFILHFNLYPDGIDPRHTSVSGILVMLVVNFSRSLEPLRCYDLSTVNETRFSKIVISSKTGLEGRFSQGCPWDGPQRNEYTFQIFNCAKFIYAGGEVTNATDGRADIEVALRRSYYTFSVLRSAIKAVNR